MIIDCHAHYAPELMFERLGKVIDKFPSIELFASDGQVSPVFHAARANPARYATPA